MPEQQICHLFTHHDRFLLLLILLDCISLGTGMSDNGLKLILIDCVYHIEEVLLVHLLTFSQFVREIGLYIRSLGEFIIQSFD